VLFVLTCGLLVPSAPAGADEPPESRLIGEVYWEHEWAYPDRVIASVTATPATWQAGDTVRLDIDYNVPLSSCQLGASSEYYGASLIEVEWWPAPGGVTPTAPVDDPRVKTVHDPAY
jgi:hypothetical protein